MNKRLRWLLILLALALIAWLLVWQRQDWRGSASHNQATAAIGATSADGTIATDDRGGGATDGATAVQDPAATRSAAEQGQGDTGKNTDGVGQAATRAGARVFGKVMLENGGLVAGATVYLVPLAGAARPFPDHMESDERGGFSFAGQLDGGYQLYASKGALLSFRNRADLRPVVVRGKDAVGPVTLTLRAAQALRLRVIDPNGKPLVGAAILAAGEMRLSYTTKDDGEARLLLSPGLWSLDVTARDHAPRMLALHLNGQQPDLLEVQLERAGLVFGTVRSTAKKKLVGAAITCISGTQEFTASSDPDGMFLFDKVPLSAPFTLHFSANGYSEAFLSGQRFILNQRQRQVDIELEPEEENGPDELTRVSGLVLDPQRQPIAGCIVSFGARERPGYRETRSNSRGLFLLEIPVPERRVVELDVMASGFAPFRGQFLLDAPQPWEIQLTQHFLGGRVVDEYGQPVAAAALHVEGRTSELAGSFALPTMDHLFTDTEGAFVLRPVPQAIELTVNARGFGRWRQTFDKSTLDRDDLEIQLMGMGQLTGRVLDPKQRPLTQFTIQVALGDGQHDDNFGEVGPWLREGGAQFWDRDGRFELHDLPRGSLKLTVSATGYSARLFVVEALPPRELQPIELIMEGTDSRLAGRLFDHNGKPLAGIRLQALAYDPNDRINSRFTWNGYFRGYYTRKALATQWTTTGRDGSFKFEALPGDAVLDLLVADPVTALTHVSGLENRSERERAAIKLSVARASSLSGQIDRRAFPLLRRLDLESVQNQSFSIGQVLDDTDSYRFESLPAGSYRLMLTAWDRPDQPQPLGTITVTLGEAEQRSLALDPRAELSKPGQP